MAVKKQKTVDSLVKSGMTAAQLSDLLRTKHLEVKKKTGNLRSSATKWEGRVTFSHLNGFTTSATSKKNIQIYICENSCYYYADEIVVLDLNNAKLLSEELTSLESNKVEIEAQIELTKNKLQYLKDSGNKEFNESEFKAYLVLQELKKEGLTDFERAKLIGKIIDSE